MDSHHGQNGLTGRDGQAMLPSFFVFSFGSLHWITCCEDLVAEVTRDVSTSMVWAYPDSALLPTSLSSRARHPHGGVAAR